MKRSRKKRSRTKQRHQRQLKEQRERETAREEKKFTPERPAPGTFWRRHVVELVLLVLMAAGVSGVYFLGPDKKAMDEVRASVSSAVEEKLQRFENDYPYGYKIIAFVGNKIVHTSFDSLPEDLNIDWKKLSVARVETRQSGDTVEKIRIVIPDISYASAGISGLTVKVAFIRRAGARSVLAQFDNDLEFIVEIIEETDDRVYCLFGLRFG